MSSARTAAGGVRPATAADLPAIADTLAAAFADYRWTRWCLPQERHLERLRAMQLYFTERIGLPYGSVWTSDDAAAVAVWTRPDTAVPPELFAGPELARAYGDRLEPMLAADAVLAEHRPAEPAWFLATVGVRPHSQGRGLGRAVIEPGLRAADASGHPCFLETSEEANVELYRRFGFEVTAVEDALPGAAPTTWSMLRAPQV
ncbi:acetyltransferase (GNAT) family protein [Murinocardiopsis flavida]|uniref:Acetyltransferase (GNAT) family protein n=1 Tax=Murinocardiopsis flavida TaxID=645275 RepID=A0A2P8DE05_9ACTN|nr:GNAT family N-acetyltransferase [Murinocardiopsis flavida]PSK95432.1 acetyltransferase (GNAT) family protein [Murinocardiopsis flavida]